VFRFWINHVWDQDAWVYFLGPPSTVIANISKCTKSISSACRFNLYSIIFIIFHWLVFCYFIYTVFINLLWLLVNLFLHFMDLLTEIYIPLRSENCVKIHKVSTVRLMPFLVDKLLTSCPVCGVLATAPPPPLFAGYMRIYVYVERVLYAGYA
jgi:hypothetical protein